MILFSSSTETQTRVNYIGNQEDTLLKRQKNHVK